MDTIMIEETLIVKSPLTGYLVPIEDIPDPVFAQKMVGDGVSIDPVDQILKAPVDGTIIQIHSCRHAITIKTLQNVEILIHIGIDTVKLKGQGFKTLVQVGDKIRCGDALIEFDADFIALNAKSLLTQILVTSGNVTLKKSSSGMMKSNTDVLFTISRTANEEISPSGNYSTHVVKSQPLDILNPTGLHARPAAILAATAKKFKSEIKIKRGEQWANGKSVVSIMGLEISYGDKIVLVAEGNDSAQAVDELMLTIKNGLGENLKQKTAPEKNPVESEINIKSGATKMKDPNIFSGVAASHGLAVGFIYQIRQQEIEVADNNNNDPVVENKKLIKALELAKQELQNLREKLVLQGNSDKGAIFAAHEELLQDPDLLEVCAQEIDQGKSADFAWKKAYSFHAERLARLHNELLAARANDLKDVGQRVLRHLVDDSQNSIQNISVIPENSILVAENLTPSETASLDRSKVLGFCSTTGGASSHVAILARSLAIPAIAGIDEDVLKIPSGTQVILDGFQGSLKLNPKADEISRIQIIQNENEQKQKNDLTHAHDASITVDGHKIEIFANIGGLADAEQAMALGGEGVGLLRSEFLFLKKSKAPTEEEQYTVYNDIAQALNFKNPLTIRTLDVGGDKPLAYLPIAAEENPFLGERGIRVSLNHPEIFREQLRAILRAAKGDQIRIMFPMVATLAEWREAKKILEEERQNLGLKPVLAGIMIEVPAAAVMADVFATEVDFFSIGTNDLTQYTLAMDRGHAKLAASADGLHPSVLRLIDLTVKAAHRHNKWVGICGGIASDIQAVPILVGLGVDELSVSVPAIPGIKAQIRSLTFKECQEIANIALEKATALEVRSLVPNSSL